MQGRHDMRMHFRTVYCAALLLRAATGINKSIGRFCSAHTRRVFKQWHAIVITIRYTVSRTILNLTEVFTDSAQTPKRCCKMFLR